MMILMPFVRVPSNVRNPFKKAKPASKQTVSSALVSGRFVTWSFHSKYKKLFRSEPEICLIDRSFIQLRSKITLCSWNEMTVNPSICFRVYG